VRRLRSIIRKSRERRIIRGVLAIGALVLPAAALANAVPSGGKIGSLTFSGQLQGRLKLPKHWDFTSGASKGLSTFGCLYPYAAGGKKTPLIRFYDDDISLSGHKQKVNLVQLQLTVSGLGKAESLAPKTSGYSQVLLTLSKGSGDYVWGSTAGTLKVNGSGSGGSMNATLMPGGHDGTPFDQPSPGLATQQVKVSGSWSWCNRGVAG
jgi:hypothetical protein